MQRLSYMLIAAALALPAGTAAESNVSVNINVGVPAPPVVGIGPRVVFEAPPLFLAPPSLGFYVGVDMPYDLMLVSGVYYLFQGNHWYRANHYNGPWVVTRYEQLPAPVRRYKVERIRYHRDHEYRAYHDHREQYRGKKFRPDRDDRDDRKEMRRQEHEERKQHKQRHGQGGPRGDRD